MHLPLLLSLALGAASLQVHAATGRFVEPESLPSEALGTNRTVRIWLPPSYDAAADRRFPVLYLHDGQNVLSSAGPHVAFGWGNWEVDKSVERLAAEGRMREIILVAIDNTRQRFPEYRGPSAGGEDSVYQAYRRFLIEELKPMIDRRYRTLPDAANTGVMGSSLGGIVSLALAWDRPDVFGLAASVSGAFQVEQKHFLGHVLKTHRDGPKPFRIYLDSGISSGRGDDGRTNTLAVANELRRIGWVDGVNLKHHLDEVPLTAEQLAPFNLPPDKLKEAQTAQHNELYWRLRVWRPLEFLFPPQKSATP
ncbi:MAG TPA: hypothetical protein DCY13_11270 [Verrucomicrobiales bacterium]|nr:hypothetical protein [Verrucomicrobiales bacterium]